MNTHAREEIQVPRTFVRDAEIPKFNDRGEAGVWLGAHSDIFPADPHFAACVDKLIAGELQWSDIDAGPA